MGCGGLGGGAQALGGLRHGLSAGAGVEFDGELEQAGVGAVGELAVLLLEFKTSC